MSNTSKKYDVYFYTDDGVKLRSFPEIEKCFEEKGNGEQAERSCFNFTPLQTNAVHGICELNKKLEHAKYLTVNRDRVRKLYSSNSGVVKASDLHCLPISCTVGRLDTTCNWNMSMAGIDTMAIKNDRGASKLSHAEALTPASSMSCKGVEASCTEQLSTVQSIVVQNHLKHAQIKSDTQLSSSVCSALNPNATTDQPNKYSEKNHSRQEHTPVTTARDKKVFSSFEKVKSSNGSKFLSTNYDPSNGRKRNRNDPCNVAGIDVLAEKSNKRAKKSAENGTMMKSQTSIGYRKSCDTFIGMPLRSSEVVDESMTLKECEPHSHFDKSQGNGKRLATLQQKKSQALTSTSRTCIKCSHPRRKYRRNVPITLHFQKKLKSQEQKAKKSCAEETKKASGQLYKGAHKLWLKCHRFSNTEKVHFVQKLHKNWTTSYITRCCGKLSGWTRVITQRQSGSTSGIWDVHYVSPRKERFRSKRAIERFIMSNSININPELFCFSSSILDFEVLTSNAKCNDIIRKKEPRLERISLSRVPVAEKNSKIHLDSDIESNSVQQRKSKQWPSLSSTDSLSKVTERKQDFFRDGSNMSTEQFVNNVEFQFEEKRINPIKDDNPVIAGETNFSENTTTELQLQGSILAQIDGSQKHSSGSDLSQPLKDSDCSNKISVECKITQAEHIESVEFNSSSANQDVAHDASESSMSKGYVGLLPIEENAVEIIDHVLTDVVRAPTSNPVKTNNTCIEHCSTVKNSEIISTSNLLQGSDFIDSFTRSKTAAKIAILNNDRAPCRSSKPDNSIDINSCFENPVKRENVLAAEIFTLNNNLDETYSRNESGMVNSDISSYFVEIAPHWDRDNESSQKHSLDRQKPPRDEALINKCNSLLYGAVISGGTVTNSKEELNGLPRKDECRSFEQAELDDIQYRDICSRPLQTVSHVNDKISTGGSYETNEKSFACTIKEARFTNNCSHIGTDSCNCFSTHLTQSLPIKQFGAKEATVNTADSLEAVKNYYVGNHPIGVSKSQVLIDLQPSSSFSKEFNALSPLGELQDLCNEDKSYSDQFENNASSYGLRLTEVENALSALDLNSSHVLWQGAQITGLCFEKRQISVEERGDFSRQKVFPYSGCDLEKSCNFNAGESYTATEDSMPTTNLDIVALPGHLKRKIKCNEKVLQFFKENARNCKKKSSVATNSFIKRCYPGVSSCTKISRTVGKPRMVYNGSSVERLIDKDNIVVPIPLTEADSLEREAVSAVSLDIASSLLSPSISSTGNTKKKSLWGDNVVKQHFPKRHSTGADKERQEIKSIKSKEGFQHEKTFDIALQNENGFAKCLSRNRIRKRKTVTSPYFSKRQKSKDSNEHVRSCDEHYSDIRSYQIRNETILQFDCGNVESANFCCKCGCVVTDIQTLQSLKVCEMCKARRYSSVAKVSQLQNAIHKYPYDSQLFYSASRKHDSDMKDDLSTIPKISMKHYLESLGLAPRSASCGGMAALDSNISHGQPMTNPGAFGSIVNYESNSQLPVRHRRLGIQRFHLHSSTQLRKCLVASPCICFHKKNQQRKIKKKGYCGLNSLVNPTEEVFCKENDEGSNSNKNLSLLSVSPQATHMLDKNHRGLGTRGAHSTSHVNSYLMLNGRQDAANDRICESAASVGNAQAASSSIFSIDGKLKNERGLDVVANDAYNAKLIDSVDHVDDRYREDSDWNCSRFGIDATRSKCHRFWCPEGDSPTGSKEINAIVPKDQNFFTCSDDLLHFTEPLCTNGTEKINARPFDSANGAMGMNAVLYGENMPAKQLRGKHTQVHYIPPRSPFCLIQEQLYENPWKLLIACLFLNRTTAKQVFPVIGKFFQFWPDPEATMNADWHEIKGIT